MGRAYLALGRLDLALTHQEAGLTISREANNRPAEMHSLAFLGDVYRALEQEARAAGYCWQALALAQELGAGAWAERMERALQNADLPEHSDTYPHTRANPRPINPAGASGGRPGPSRRSG
jgi:tetratricopeptide (TPR) repeat protein